MIAFVLGLFIGAQLGVIAAALMVASGRPAPPNPSTVTRRATAGHICSRGSRHARL